MPHAIRSRASLSPIALSTAARAAAAAPEPHRLRPVWGVIAAGLALAATSARAADVSATGPVIELPKFVVTDSRDLPPPESWRYASFPGFEILSNASDRTTQRLMTDFKMFREALDVVWPMPSQMNTPVLLILCGRGDRFKSFEPPKSAGSPETGRASLYLQGRAHSAIVIDVESSVINVVPGGIDDPGSGVDSSQISIDHNKQLYREYVRYLLSRSQPRLPAWFEEGMAQIVMAMKFDSTSIEFGKLEDPNTVSPAAAMAANLSAATGGDADVSGSDTGFTMGAPAEDRDFNAALAHRALIPFNEFFAVDHSSPVAMNPLGNNAWAKQAYAFVHMGLFGERGRWQKPFTEFLLRSTREPVTEAMMKDCFKMSYRDMGIQLRGYIQSPYYTERRYRSKDGKPVLTTDPIALRDATPAEVGRIKGEAMVLAGNTGAARTEFIAPYIRGERDPQLLGALGLSEQAAGKQDRARTLLAAAAQGHTTDPEVYWRLAQLRYDDAVAAPAGKDGQFSAAQVKAILEPLNTARTLPPATVTTYELMAETLAHSEARPQRTDLPPLVEGVRLFPSRLKLVYATATLAADAGLIDTAQSLVAYGVKSAPDAATKASFQRLQAALPAATPTAAPAGAPTAAPASAAKK